MGDEWYWVVGNLAGALAAFAAFIGGWWYSAATYGFLFGFGLGWLPAGILAVITFFAVKVLWGPALLGIAYLFISNR
jgi:hypothetical protein